METKNRLRNTAIMMSSYRTYEEWKLWSRRVYKEILCVLTVPMRNGNEYQEDDEATRVRFLPYLWGMETKMIQFWVRIQFESSYRTYEEWKLENIKPLSNELYVLTVPMRNGNVSEDDFVQQDISSSYRTYEEWKPSTSNNSKGARLSSYRTYEEWKLLYLGGRR